MTPPLTPVTIRSAVLADAASLASVHVAAWRAAYAGIVHPEFLASLTEERSAIGFRTVLESLAPPRALLVALDASGAIAGFALCGPRWRGDASFAAEIKALYVLPEHQGRGLGRALVRAAAIHLEQCGLGSLIVWCLRDNQSCGFYEAMGGVRVATGTTRIGGVDYPSVAFGWRDLATCARGAER